MLQGLRIDGYFSWYNGWSVATEHKLQHIQTKKIFKTLSETRKLREQYAEEDKCFSCVLCDLGQVLRDMGIPSVGTWEDTRDDVGAI